MFAEQDMQTVAGNGREFADCSMAINLEMQRLQKLKAVERTIKAIEFALESMGQGQYGTCLKCHESIALKRLEVMPYAKFCQQCQAYFESWDPVREYPGKSVNLMEGHCWKMRRRRIVT